MATIYVIKLTAEDHSDLDRVAQSIKMICDQADTKIRGPIPLPTRRLVVPCRKSPDGEGSETFDHWEMRIHKRLIEVHITSGKDESTLRNIAKVTIPDSVAIEMAMRRLN